MFDQHPRQIARPKTYPIGPRPPASSYTGVHADRRRRFDARSARRGGDWFILAVPTPLLWLEEIDDVYVPAEDVPWGWWQGVAAGIWY